VLGANLRDLAFALFYEQDALLGKTRCVAACGIEPMDAQAWPIAQATETRREIYLEGQALRAVGELPGGPWPESAGAAGIHPIAVTEQTPIGFLVAGVSPRRPLDDDYRDFLRLVASNVAAVVSAVRALAGERAWAEALAEIDRAKTTFFSNVSHEFRTPLTLMLGSLDEALEARELPLAHREQLAMIRRNGLRLLRLVNPLLDFSRIEAGRIESSFELTDNCWAAAMPTFPVVTWAYPCASTRICTRQGCLRVQFPTHLPGFASRLHW
jgi:signal transduction histidine kinase